MTDLISVIVPIYNAEKYLCTCLNSVLAQIYSTLEIILIDDGSKDRSGVICDTYAAKDSRIRVIHQENQGVSAARNHGLRVATGNYICFIDSDDSIEPEMLQLLYEDLQQNEADLAVCGCYHVLDNGERIVDNTESCQSKLSKEEALKYLLYGVIIKGALWNKLFKASILKGVLFDQSIHVGEDMLFAVQAILNCKGICYRSTPLYHYYHRNTGAFFHRFDEKTYSDHTARLKMIESIRQDGNPELIDIAHTSLLLCNMRLMERLYKEKDSRKQYCKKISKNIRDTFNWRYVKDLSIAMKIGILSAGIHHNLFFFLLFLKKWSI